MTTRASRPEPPNRGTVSRRGGGAAEDQDHDPVVIGGLGGSGTRVVADALLDVGVDLGRPLNGAQDNLLFTAMFKRPRWFARAAEVEVADHLDTFVRVHRGRALRAVDRARLARCVVDHDPTVGLRESARRVRAARARPDAPGPYGPPRWGWKEPNTHLYLPHLIDAFAGLRYVYVARHGLDMACNANTTQLRLFGAQFGVPFPVDRPEAVAGAQLRFWIAMTERAVELGRALGDRFLFVRFDDVCRAPEAELRRLLAFVGLAPSPTTFPARLAAIATPASTGRWRERSDLAVTPEQRDAIRAFGFDL